MKRTQIYLDAETLKFLKTESKANGASISELIRQSIRENLNKKTRKILSAVDEVSGLWKDRAFDVNKRIRAVRKDRKRWSL